MRSQSTTEERMRTVLRHTVRVLGFLAICEGPFLAIPLVLWAVRHATAALEN